MGNFFAIILMHVFYYRLILRIAQCNFTFNYFVYLALFKLRKKGFQTENVFCTPHHNCVVLTANFSTFLILQLSGDAQNHFKDVIIYYAELVMYYFYNFTLHSKMTTQFI